MPLSSKLRVNASSAWHRPAVRRSAAALLLLFAIAACWRNVVQPALLQPTPNLSSLGNDFAAYFMGAWETAQGNSPYHRVEITDRVQYVLTDHGRQVLGTTATSIPGFVYPPPLALLLRPLVGLEFATARALWNGFNLLLLLVCAGLTLRLMPAVPDRWLAAGAVAVVYGASMPVRETILLGQVNLLVLGLCLLAAVAHLRRRNALAGCLLAVAAWLKIIPAFLLLFFVGRQNWRAAIAGFALTGAAVGVIVTVWLGVNETLHYFLVILPEAGQQQLAIDNKAFLAMFERLFGTNPLVPVLIESTAARLVAKAAFVVLVLYGWVALRRRCLAADLAGASRAIPLFFAGTLAAMLLCQPLLQIHHLVLAFPALLMLLVYFPYRMKPRLALLLPLAALLLNSRGWNAFASVGSHPLAVFLIAPQAWGLLVVAALLLVLVPAKANTNPVG